MDLRWMAAAAMVLCVGSCVLAAAERAVNESARKIPVAYKVDVVVVGGTTAGVAAATAAAKGGASVFLAAGHPYLGEDVCATLRLWLPAGAEPDTELGRRLFDTPAAGVPVRKGATFTYEADPLSAAKHKDTRPPSRLSDGLWHNAPSASVQYDGDVTIVADLGKVRPLKAVHVMAYQRDGDFEVAKVEVSTGEDGKAWGQPVTIANALLGKGGYEGPALTMSADVTGQARYVKFVVRKSDRVSRVLLGEIAIETADDEPKPAAEAPPRPRVTTPLHVKATLDAALMEAGVKFLFGCYATDVLRDDAGRPCGIVVANRAGRQAVVAKVIIDATDRGWVARSAGATMASWPGGKQTLRRVLVGGPTVTGEGLVARKVGVSLAGAGGGRGGPADYEVIEAELALPLPGGDFASLAAAEQMARDRTFHPDQARGADVLFQVPPDAMRGQADLAGPWPGAEKVDLGVFRPAGVERVFVLGGCAAVPRDVAAELLRPLGLMAVGGRIGQAAAAEAGKLPAPAGAHVPAGPAGEVGGEVREHLTGVRPTQDLPGLPSAGRGLGVLGEYDVVVIGGGTSGAPAAIGAARKGAKVLLVEYQHALGGVGTIGMIGTYYHGYRGGFTAEVDAGVQALGAAGSGPKVEWKAEWWRREARKAGAEIWFGAMGCGAVVEGGRVTGAVVATPAGRGVVLAKVVIDSTGHCDIAAAAGAPCIYSDGAFLAMQGTGLSPRGLGAQYTNTDYTFADEADMLDVWRLFVYAHKRYASQFDLSPLIDTRERRRIVGDYVVNVPDILCGRTYPDTIGLSKSDFDTHGYTVDPVFVVRQPDKREMTAYTPYRALLPAGLEGVLVTGLGMSAHRDAMPILRMQPDLQNQGYAAGLAASMAASAGGITRKIDIRALQKQLVEIGNIPDSAAADEDNFPLPSDQVEAAVKNAKDDPKAVAVILAHPARAAAALREAHAAAAGEDRLLYAHILAVLGDSTGNGDLIAAAEASPKWDPGWNFRGMGQFGRNMSRTDSYFIALGLARCKQAAPAILRKVALLDASSDFSHHRAVAVALENIGDRSAAAALAELLAKDGMTGHAIHEPGISADRSLALRELILARALFRLGDSDGLGKKILTDYTNDLRGVLARHAQAVLAGK